MRAMPIAIALILVPAATQVQEARAQDEMQALNEGIRFTLKPRAAAPWVVRSAAAVDRARLTRLSPISADDRGHAMDVLVQRQRLSLSREGGGAIDPLARASLHPRSRLLLLSVEDRVPMDHGITVMAGFQGVKISNRSANVTAIGSNDRLRVRDAFLPRAGIAVDVAPGVDLSIAYRETLHGFGETGVSGPLGLTRDDFRALTQALRAERHSRLRMDMGWRPLPGLSLAISAHDGRIADRLSFVEGGYMPRNGGSAQLRGGKIMVGHQVSRHWHWSMRYSNTRLRQSDGSSAREASMAVEAGWQAGRWSAMLRGTKGSTPMLAGDIGRWNPRVRVEGEMRYRLPGAVDVSLRLNDPDRLASSAFLRDDPAGPVRAGDQARALMLGVAMPL